MKNGKIVCNVCPYVMIKCIGIYTTQIFDGIDLKLNYLTVLTFDMYSSLSRNSSVYDSIEVFSHNDNKVCEMKMKMN